MKVEADVPARRRRGLRRERIYAQLPDCPHPASGKGARGAPARRRVAPERRALGRKGRGESTARRDGRSGACGPAAGRGPLWPRVHGREPRVLRGSAPQALEPTAARTDDARRAATPAPPGGNALSAGQP